MKDTIFVIIIFVVGIAVVISLFGETNLGAVDISATNTVSNSSSTVSTSAVEVFGQDGALVRYIAVDGPADVYCSASATSTGVVAKEGILLKASSTEWFTVAENNLYPNSLWCLTESGTSILDTLEIY